MATEAATVSTAPLAHSIPCSAARIGVGRSKLYELITAGEIRTFSVGSRKLVAESELQRFIAERMTGVQ